MVVNRLPRSIPGGEKVGFAEQGIDHHRRDSSSSEAQDVRTRDHIVDTTTLKMTAQILGWHPILSERNQLWRGQRTPLIETRN
jgi:hypothetical protein